jgi:hypothetical protein
MPSVRRLVALCIAAACAALPEIPPELIQLARIKQQMKERLSHIANLTCLETIQRSTSGRTGRMEKDDTLQLEVAFVDGKELYSLPGAGKFEESNIGAFTKQGTIGNGLFASHARSIFLEKWPTYRYAGEERVRGRRAVRYTYEFPLLGSGYQLKMGTQRAVVGYSGAFWADAETSQMIRLLIRADNIPIRLGLREALQTIEYERVRLNDMDFLLPQSAETILRYLAGGESRNRTDFSHWLQYVGVSNLVFEDTPSAPVPAESKIELPPGLVLSTRLETEIRSARALAGDRIEATVDREARWKKELIVPVGAKLTGRIRSIEKPGGSGSFILTLEFSELRIGSRKARFFARLAEVSSTAGGVRKMKDEGLLGIGSLQIHGESFRLSRELRLIWKMGDL